MKIVIMQGAPGSGKSTYAKALQGAVVCSADDYFMVNGEYRFDVTKLSEAHGACLKKFASRLIDERRNVFADCNYLVVDNTNATALEIAPYVALAQAYGRKVQLVRVHCFPKTASKRNTHGVPYDSIVRMTNAIRACVLPRYWDIEYKDHYNQ